MHSHSITILYFIAIKGKKKNLGASTNTIQSFCHDNSDDEKRLFRAEARAGRKKQRSLKDSNKKKGANR